MQVFDKKHQHNLLLITHDHTILFITETNNFSYQQKVNGILPCIRDLKLFL